jgi:hypothetical protein
MRTELPIKQEREVDRVENFRNDGSKPVEGKYSTGGKPSFLLTGQA